MGSEYLQLSYNMQFSVIALGITLPISFNIQQAFLRRERALITIAELKGSVVALYWQHRDWAQDDGFPHSLGDDRKAWAMEFANVAMEMLTHLEQYLKTTNGWESLSELRLSARKKNALALMLADTRLQLSDSEVSMSFITRVNNINKRLPGHRHLQAAYRCLSRISVMNEYLTFKAKYLRGGEGGMSRTNQFLRYMIASFEQLRMIKLYRTPFMLRYCVSVLIHLGAVALGPYFRHVAACDVGWELTSFGCPGPYIMACAYGVICNLLLSVQAQSEMPFDNTGLDDIFLELTQEFSDVLDLEPADPINDSGDCFNPVKAPTAHPLS
eukprot:gene12854-12981_t